MFCSLFGCFLLWAFPLSCLFPPLWQLNEMCSANETKFYILMACHSNFSSIVETLPITWIVFPQSHSPFHRVCISDAQQIRFLQWYFILVGCFFFFFPHGMDTALLTGKIPFYMQDYILQQDSNEIPVNFPTARGLPANQ